MPDISLSKFLVWKLQRLVFKGELTFCVLFRLTKFNLNCLIFMESFGGGNIQRNRNIFQFSNIFLSLKFVLHDTGCSYRSDKQCILYNRGIFL